MSDLAEMFVMQEGVLAMVLRGTVVYCFIFLLVRVAGRREIGSLGTADILVLVMVADAAGGAMTGSSPSVTDGLVVVATIVAWSVILNRVAYYSPMVHRLLEPDRVCLVRDGRIIQAGLRNEHISRGELMEQLRIKGVDSLGQVKRAYIEANGEFSVIEIGKEVPDTPSTRSEP